MLEKQNELRRNKKASIIAWNISQQWRLCIFVIQSPINKYKSMFVN